MQEDIPDSGKPMFKTSNKIDLKEFLLCNIYYLKKYIGIKEPILLGLLWVAGIVMETVFHRHFVIIMAGVTTGLIIIAVVIYVVVTIKTFRLAYSKRQATKWDMFFNDTGYVVDTYEKNGDEKYSEKRLFADVAAVAILKDRVYIYGSTAIMYYVMPESFTEGNFAEFCEWLKSVLPPEKRNLRKMNRRNKQFPYHR